MTIEAYLDQTEDEIIEEVKELTPEAYKGIADTLAISKAEQSIIDEVTGVDDDNEEQEKEEMESEREMKTLFESLYEIDPETKEVFVKGSAYDLKKWEDDMVCFVFGDPTRVVAMEDAISPAEHRLTKAFEKLNVKRTALSHLVKKHADHLKAKTITKAFAKDFQDVMGFPIPNVRMESFTTEPSTTNYQIAMEEMSGAQMAMAAGGALVGIGIIYKMIQWFARALNKNGDATNSIGQNFKEAFDRKQRMRTAAEQLEIDKKAIDDTIDAVRKDFTAVETNEADMGLNALKDTLQGGSTDKIYDQLSFIYLNGALKGQLNQFNSAIIKSQLKQEWWNTLTKLATEAVDAQITLGATIQEVTQSPTLPPDKPDLIAYGNFLPLLKQLMQPFALDKNIPEYNNDKKNGNQVEVMEKFISSYQTIFTPLTGFLSKDTASTDLENSFNSINLEAFNQFTDKYINSLLDTGKAIQSEVEKETALKKNGNVASSNTNSQDLDAKRLRLTKMVAEFKAVSNLLRFIINVRNNLGKLAIANNNATQKAEGKIMGILKATGATIDKLRNFSHKATNALKGNG